MTVAQAAVAGTDVYWTGVKLLYGSVKETSAVSAIVLCAYISGLLCVLLRRIILTRITVRCYGCLASEWPSDEPVRGTLRWVLCSSVAAVTFELVADNVLRYVRGDPMHLYELTKFASLGFEMQLIYTFYTIGQLYGNLNHYVESGIVNDLECIQKARRRNLVLYEFCRKFNSHYSIDLIIHLTCYQLYVLLELFKFVKRLSTSIGTENFIFSFFDLAGITYLIRIARLFVVFIYIIESSSYLHNKSVSTFYYILRCRMNCMSHQIKEQINLFLNELNATEVTISASHCYDVNKKFLFSVFSSIVAYLILIISFLYGGF